MKAQQPQPKPQKFDFNYWMLQLWEVNKHRRKDNIPANFESLMRRWRNYPMTNLAMQVIKLRAKNKEEALK